jgi:hypothetical protein
MRKFALPMFGLMILAAAVPAPVHAQGDGGYAPDCPGAETVRMSGEERERARAAHQTNDTNGGFSSIDKSCKTWKAAARASARCPAPSVTAAAARDGAGAAPIRGSS